MPLDIDICRDLRVGDIICDVGTSDLSDIIDDFQSIKSSLYGKYTHSMTVCEIEDNCKVWVSEAIDENIVGSICITDFQTYLNSGNKLIRLRYKAADTSLKADIYKQLAYYYDGRATYNFWGLFQQAYRFTRMIFNKNFILHIKNTINRFMCGSWSAYNLWYIYLDKFFQNFTAIAPVDNITSGLFDLQIINRD